MGDDFANGMKLFREVYGDKLADGMAAYVAEGKGFGVEQARWSADFAFGRVWVRDGLDRKSRSCTVLGMVIAQGAFEEIKFHCRMGMKNGLSRTELEEILYTTIPYCGFPASATAKKAMLEAFAEMDQQGHGA
jgi:4-carboxymuconolactone decarboxylase